MTEHGITLPADSFRRAWEIVSTARAPEPRHPYALHAVCVEVFNAGVRLVATDGYVLLWEWVPNAGPDGAWLAPDATAAPKSSFLIADGLDLIGQYMKTGDEIVEDVEGASTVRSSLPGTIHIERTATDVTIHCPEERRGVIQIPAENVRTFPQWRTSDALNERPVPTDHIGLSLITVETIADALAAASHRRGVALKLSLTRPMGPIALSGALNGILMPCRVDE